MFLYGMESWTLKVSDTNKLEAFEMWLYSRILKDGKNKKRVNGKRELLQ